MSKEHEKATVADATDHVVHRMASGAHGAIDQAAGVAASGRGSGRRGGGGTQSASGGMAGQEPHLHP